MTTTLVVGNPQGDRAQHAESLLSAHPQVTYVSTSVDGDRHLEPSRPWAAPRPRHWSLVETSDLTRALLSSRSPVLIDNLPSWVDALLDDPALRSDPQAARGKIGGLVDELCLALSAVPFETVTLTSEAISGNGSGSLRDHLVAFVNSRVAGVSTEVHAVMFGRVIDLSNTPLVGRI